MSAAPKGPHPRFKLWISTDGAQGVFGDGKWRLLAAIQREGSLKAASQSLAISYRKAWGDLKKAERCLGTTFLQRHRGGRGGGDSTLTEVGRKWLDAYSRFRGELERAADKSFEKNVRGLLRKEKKGK